MAFHPDITRKDTVSLALDTANAAVRIASRQLTGNAGTVEIPNADGTSTIMGVGAGETGIAPWVGNKTAPGKPLGITAESHNGAVWVSWGGTLDGGVPPYFDHVRFTAVDGSKKVDMGQLTAAGKVTAAELTAGDTVTITAIAYDNAHAADGSSAPNASEVSDPVTVVVKSAVDASAVKKAQDDAQSALDKVGKATDAANLALANAQNMVMNTGNDLNNTWSNRGVTAENGVYTRTFPGNENHVDFLWGSLSGKAIPGHTYSISFDARVDSGNYVSDDYFTFGWTDAWYWVESHHLSNDWQQFTGKTTVGGNGTDAPKFYMSSFMNSDGAKVVQFRNLSIKDITEAQAAQTTADGKNKIFSSASEPAHTGLVPGDLWFQLNSSNHVTGIQVWNGSAFADYILVANEILVAGSVGTVQIANGAVTADQIGANAVTAIKIAAQTITGDKLNVGSVAAAIITSGLFQTSSSGARVKMDSTGITGYDSKGSTTFRIDATTGDVSMIGKFYSGDPSVSRVIIDNDYTKISDPGFVDVDGCVAFESHLSDESPFIGGMHGAPHGTKNKAAGAIFSSGVTDSSHPSRTSLQLNSYEAGNGSEGNLISSMDKMDLDKNFAQVGVTSSEDEQMALLIASGPDKGKYAAVKAYVDQYGNHNVDIVATDIRRVDPMTGSVSELSVGDTGWVDISSGFVRGISGTMKVRVKDGIVYIDVDCSGFDIAPYATVLLGSVPSQYLPTDPGMNSYVATGTATWFSGIVRLERNGNLAFQNIERSNADSCRCSFTPYILN